MDVLLFKRFTVESLQTARLLASYLCKMRWALQALKLLLVSVFVLTSESSFGVVHRLVEETDIAVQHYDNL